MAKIYNITSKMTDEKPKIIWGEREYEVNDLFINLFKFDELDLTSKEGIEEILNTTLGIDHGIELDKLSTNNIKVLVTAIIAAIQGIDFDEAASRFQL